MSISAVDGRHSGEETGGDAFVTLIKRKKTLWFAIISGLVERYFEQGSDQIRMITHPARNIKQNFVVNSTALLSLFDALWCNL